MALFALALVVRCLPWCHVFASERTAFAGSDAYYHLRRIAWSLDHFPWVLGRDPYLNHPAGGRAIWPPLFDQALAVLLWPVHRLGGLEAVERAAALVPPVLGAATVVLVWGLARRVFDRPSAAIAGGVLTLLSGHAWYSQLGFVDHHVAVSLLAVVLLHVAVSLVGRGESAGWRVPLAWGASVAVALLCWPGALLFVAIGEAGWGLYWLTRPQRAAARRVALQRAFAWGLAALVVLPWAALQSWEHWGPFSPSVLSGFQPWALSLLAVHALMCRLLWSRPRWGRTPGRRALAIGGLGLALLGASLALLPGLDAAGDEAWRWLARREAFQSGVFESRPLFSGPDGLSTRVAELRLSRLLYAGPVAGLALLVVSRGSARRRERWLVVFWCGVVLAATLAQRRFFDSGAIAVALLAGWAAPAAARAAARWTTPGLARAGVAALTIWALLPTTAAYTEAVGVRGEDGQPLTRVGAHFAAQRPLLETAEWIAQHTPETAGFDDPDERPEYGLMSHWDLGHVLLYVGRRPTVVGNFGDDVGPRNFRLHHRYLASPESEAVRILDELEARYVVVEAPREAVRRRLPEGAVLRRLTAPELRQLRHHRLVYESRPTPTRLHFTQGYRVFERVEGARVEGRSAPGARVEARAWLPLGEGRGRALRSATRADREGRYRLRIAQPEPRWTLVAGPHEATLRVPEAAVRSGARVEGPILGPGAPSEAAPGSAAADPIGSALRPSSLRGGGTKAPPHAHRDTRDESEGRWPARI